MVIDFDGREMTFGSPFTSRRGSKYPAVVMR